MTDNVQTVVELRPGQQINFITEGVQVTPFGEKKQEVKVLLSYEEILTRFNATSLKKQRTLVVPAEAKEFNRYAAVAQTGIEKGTWMNGAAVDQKKIAVDLVTRIKNLPENVYSYVTEKAQGHLEAIAGNKSLKPDQKKEIKDFLAKLA